MMKQLITIFDRQTSSAGWAFWFRWVLATAIGGAAAGVIVAVMSEIVFGIPGRSYYSYLLVEAGLPAVYGAVFGVVIGTAQWYVLRRERVDESRWWIVASGLGLFVGLLGAWFMTVWSSWSRAGIWYWAWPMAGALSGAMQRSVLRRRVDQPGWWVLASAMGWGVGWIVTGIVGRTIWTVIPRFDAGLILSLFIQSSIGGLVTGTTIGAITGLGLIWLLNGPRSSTEGEDVAEAKQLTSYEREILKRWNWGAALFQWIWGLYHKAYLMSVVAFLFQLIPIIGFIIFFFIFGSNGNKWAWENREWEDIDHFNSHQRGWAKVAVVILGLGLLCRITIAILEQSV